MKSNVVYYILLLLDAENAVRIPGLGVLTRRIHSAKILKKEQKINPPYSTVEFTESDKEKGRLLARYISYKSGVDTKAAAAHVSAFATNVKSSLGQSGKVNVDHLGVFQQEVNSINFTPDKSAANASYFGLKTVPLPRSFSDLEKNVDESRSEDESVGELSAAIPVIPVPADVTIPSETIEDDSNEAFVPPVVPETIASQKPESNVVDSAKESTNSATESTKRMRIPVLLPIFLAIFLGVTALAIMQYNKRDAIYHPAATYNRSPGNDIPIFGGKEEPKTEKDTELDIVNALSDEEQTLPEVISDNARDMLGLKSEEDRPGTSTNGGQVELPNADEELQDHTSTFEDEYISNENNSDDGPRVGDIRSDDIGKSAESDPTTTTNKRSYDNLTSDCYVIVGAFGVQSNVDRMMLRLAEMGYLPARMAKNNLTQIGVPAPCGTAEIKDVLEDLQLNVEAEAWIYKK